MVFANGLNFHSLHNTVIPKKGVFCTSKMLALYLETSFADHTRGTTEGFHVAGKPFAYGREE